MKLFISTVRSSNETQSLLRLQPILKVSQQLTLEYKANVLQNVIYKFKLPKKVQLLQLQVPAKCLLLEIASHNLLHVFSRNIFEQEVTLAKKGKKIAAPDSKRSWKID